MTAPKQTDWNSLFICSKFMADEPSLDAWSHTDVDGARDCRSKKRKISQAYSYPNKRDAFAIRSVRKLVVIGALAAIAFMVVYLFTNGELEDEEEDDEGEEGDEEEDEEEEEDDDSARTSLLEDAVDCFIATKAWAECELGPENEIFEQVLGMLQLIPGYEEAVKAKQKR